MSPTRFPTSTRCPFAGFVLALATSAAAQTGTTPLTFAGTTTVGSSSAPVIVTLTAQHSGTITALSALTGGSPNLDFTVTDLTCAINLPLNPGDTCTVSAVFSPQYPGIRQGAVVATAGAQLLASAPLSGVGLGSLPVLVPGTINTIAGDGDWIFQRDGIPAVNAPIFLPTGLAVDAAGDLFLCDSSNNRVRRVDATTGNISTVAGNGSPGGAGDGGSATSAQLSNPSGIAIDGAGDLFIADTGNHVVRRVDALSGVITTFAGQMGTMGYQGDGGPATSALLVAPRGLALMPGGDLLIADSGNNAVRLVNITSNRIETIAGTGAAGYNGDGIAATAAQLNDPYGVAVRPDGTIAIADLENQRVRLITPGGVISTAAGTGQRNAGTPTEEQLDGPSDVAFDPAGDLFIADAGNNRVREVPAAGGAIQTVTGTASEQFAGDAGPANQASLYGPYALIFDAHGNIWISDTFHNRVREITGSRLALTYATIKVGNVSPPVVASLSNDGNANLILSAPVLNQAALNSAATTCNQTAMAPVASCNMGIAFAPTAVGANITGSIQWPSNAPNVTPVDSLNGQVLSVNVTSVALSSSANPGALGHSIAFTAAVNSPNHSATGTVTFTEGGMTWCPTLPLNGSGTATCTLAGLALGSHTLTARYSGDANNAASTSPGYVEVIKQQPALVLSVSSNPIVVSSNLTLLFRAVDQSGTPSGTVVFFDGNNSLGSATLDGSGSGQWLTAALSVGAHSLIAQYQGDSTNISGGSNSVLEQINQANTLTTLALSAASSAVGSPLVLTATVTNSSGPALTGSVTYRDGTTVLGTQPLSAGSSVLTVSTLAPGAHSITASYSGNADNAASASTAMAETIQQIATQTTLSGSGSVLHAGATLQLTAGASLAAGATADGALTGNITFADGSTVVGTVAINSSGTALLTVSGLSVGSHTLTASFAGNTNYAASQATALTVTVQQTTTLTAMSAASSTTLAGQRAAWTVAVTSATGVPTGVVSFRDGATVFSTVTLSGGTATTSTTNLTRGTHTISASYSGDANYIASASPGLQQTVQLALPAVTLSGPTAAVDAGLSAGFVAALTTPGTAPTGSLTLLDGVSAIETVPVAGNESFPFSTAALSIGTHTITVSYSGDTNNSAVASTSVTVMVRQASTATSLLASANPLVQGKALTLTATVTSDSPHPGGAVTFLDGAAPLGSATLGTNGAASLSISALSVGTHTLTAVYGGDTNHAGSSATPVTEIVIDGSTVTSLLGPAGPTTFGQAIRLTARVTGGSAAGTVNFTDNGQSIGSATLQSGTAVLTLSTLAPGAHTVVAAYAGDGTATPSSSVPLLFSVKQNTQWTLSSNSNPAWTLNPVSFMATVTSPGAAPVTGTVSFTQGGTVIGTATVDGTGHALLTVPAMGASLYAMGASYAGDGANFPSVAGAYSQTVQLRVTTTTVTGSAGDPNNPQQVTLIAVVGGQGSIPPGGAVTFSNGGTTLGQAPVGATGVALLTTAFPQPSEQITVSYPGDINYAASQSTATIATGTITTAPQFVLAVSAPSITVVTRAHATIQINIASVTGFSDTIALGCLGLPHAGTCTFSPSQVTLPANGTASASLVVDTGNPLGSGSGTASLLTPGRGIFLCWLPIGLFAGLLRRRRGAMLVLVFAGALGLASGVSGCSGLSSAATVPGTYTIKVVGTGQGTGISETQTITLLVTQ